VTNPSAMRRANELTTGDKVVFAKK
jgi:hypothetical protein